jgi:hypothetical protein
MAKGEREPTNTDSACRRKETMKERAQNAVDERKKVKRE